MIMRKLSSPVFHSVHQIWCVSGALARFTNEYELVELNIVKTSFDLTVDFDYAVKLKNGHVMTTLDIMIFAKLLCAQIFFSI